MDLDGSSIKKLIQFGVCCFHAASAVPHIAAVNQYTPFGRYLRLPFIHNTHYTLHL
jgi:hypothetical protein